MSEWKEYKLNAITTKIGSGATPLGGENAYKNSGISLIRSQNVLDFNFSYNGLAFIDEQQAKELDNVTIQKDDILLNITGDSVARVCKVPEKILPARVNQHVSIVRSNTDLVDSNYLLYYLLNPKFKYLLLKIAFDGATRKALTKGNLENLPIKLPPIEEQKRIAAVLSCLDAKIDNLRRQNETLEKIAQTLFKHWFIDFEFPNDEGKPYKSSGGAMSPSELGDIPAGWKVGKLGDEFNIIMGQSPPGESYNEAEDGMIFFQGRTDFDFRFPKVRLYTNQPNRIAEKFDVLVSVRAPVGDVNVAFDKCCIGRGLSAVRSDYKSYCLYKIKSYNKIFNVFENEGTVFGSLNKENFNNLNSLIPQLKIVESFNGLVLPLDRKIFNNTKQIQTLTKTRDALLPKLMSGEIRIKE